MIRTKKALIVGGAVAVLIVGGVVGRILYVLHHIPEAYAAWDAGKVLVAYMDRHDGHWPGSWGALEATWIAAESDWNDDFGGEPATRATRLAELRKWVAIDWTFDPNHPAGRNPVTPIGGGAFNVLWDRAEPNEMIHDAIERRARARAAAAPATRP